MTERTKTHLRISFFSLIFFGLFALAQSSHAATRYVAPNGSGSSCTSGSPCSVSTGLAATAAGDTLIFKNGTYTASSGSNVVSLNKAGTSGSWITYKSENKWGAIISGSSFARDYCFQIGASAAYINIEDFEIQGCGGDGIQSNLGADHVRIYRNKIHNIARHEDCNASCCSGACTCGRDGVFQGPNCTDYIYDSNLIYDIGRINVAEGSTCPDMGWNWYNHDQGLYIMSDNVVIKNNIFYNMHSGWPIKISAATEPNVNNFLITNNTFYGHVNNNAQEGHVEIWKQCTNIIIQNNISHTPGRAFVYEAGTHDSGTTVVVHNNLVYNQTSCTANQICNNVGNCVVPSGYTLTNNSLGDPKFVNLANHDFHLQSSSPAINKGITYSGRTVDADGKSIVGLPDLGAYEYGGGTSDTAAPAAPIGIVVN
jgi:hypothetical protein